MKYGTFLTANKRFAGAVLGDSVYDLALCFFHAKKRPFKWEDVRAFIESGRSGDEIDLTQYAREPRCLYKLKGTIPCAPITRPPKIVAVGLNYRGHAAEQNKPVPEAPLLFAKSPTAVIGPEDVIRIPKEAPAQVDPEVELGVVIGKSCHHVKRDDALGVIFGFTIVNDVSARDVQAKDKQWFRAKSFPTFAPMGPVVVTPDEIDPLNLTLELKVNGEVRQHGVTSDMAFDALALVEYISSMMPLEPGDVIATGTPAGVGLYRKPPVFLKPGDLVEASIAGIGTISNPVEAC